MTLAGKVIKHTENNSEENSEKGCADGIIDSVKDKIDSVPKDFEELTEADKDKNLFIKYLIKIFAILLSTKYNSLQKIKNIIKY